MIRTYRIEVATSPNPEAFSSHAGWERAPGDYAGWELGDAEVRAEALFRAHGYTAVRLVDELTEETVSVIEANAVGGWWTFRDLPEAPEPEEPCEAWEPAELEERADRDREAVAADPDGILEAIRTEVAR